MKTDPIRSPVVNASLDRMNGLQRTAEAFRYALLSLEFWLSPEGQLRQWVKANTRFAVFIATPTFMAFPVITVALWEMDAWMNALTAIASKLIVLPIVALLALVSITVVCRIIRTFKP